MSNTAKTTIIENNPDLAGTANIPGPGQAPADMNDSNTPEDTSDSFGNNGEKPQAEKPKAKK